MKKQKETKQKKNKNRFSFVRSFRWFLLAKKIHKNETNQIVELTSIQLDVFTFQHIYALK